MKTLLTSLALFASLLVAPAQYHRNSATTNSEPALISFIQALTVNPTNGITIGQATNAANAADTVVSNALTAKIIATNGIIRTDFAAADTVVSNGLSARLIATNSALTTAFGAADTVVSNGVYTAATNFARNAGNIASGTVAAARLGSGTANATTVLFGDNVWRGTNTIGTGGGSSGGNILTTNVASLTPTSTISFVQGDIAGTRESYMDFVWPTPHIEVGGQGWFQVDTPMTNSQYAHFRSWLIVDGDTTINGDVYVPGTLNAGNQNITVGNIGTLQMAGITNKYLYVGTDEVVVGTNAPAGGGTGSTNLTDVGTIVHAQGSLCLTNPAAALELGSTTDTSITRASAGVVAVEGTALTKATDWNTAAKIITATGSDFITNNHTATVTFTNIALGKTNGGSSVQLTNAVQNVVFPANGAGLIASRVGSGYSWQERSSGGFLLTIASNSLTIHTNLLGLGSTNWMSGDASIGGNLGVAGTFSADTFNSTNSNWYGNLLPAVDNSVGLGSAAKRWTNVVSVLFTGSGGGLTNLTYGPVIIPGSNITVTTNTVSGTGQKTYTIDSTASGGSSAWELDANGDLMPSLAASSDTYWELDGNGDLEPKL